MANERDTAVPFATDVLSVCSRYGFKCVRFFAVLDNVSTDDTRELLVERAETEHRLEVVWAPENRCIVDAYLTGYRSALEAGSDWLLEIDAGYSHRPSDIPLLIEKMAEGYDCVFGSRFCEGGDMSQNSLKRRLLSRGGTLLSNILLRTKLKDMTSGFQLFKRSAIEMILRKGIRSSGPFFQTEMKAYCAALRTAEVPITYSGANHSIGGGALADSFIGLWRLYRMRLQGQL